MTVDAALSRDHFDIPRHTHNSEWQGFPALLAMGDFIADDATQLGIDLLLVLSVANTAKVKIGAIADVELVVVRPADEAVILIGDLHGRFKSLFACLRNGLGDLLLLVALGIVALATTYGDDTWTFGMLELAVGTLLPV